MKNFPLFSIPAAIILCGVCAYLGYYFKIFDTVAITIFAGIGLLAVIGFIVGVINLIISLKNKN
jgi:membrane protein DedA with SNARE-associated domain